MKKKYTQRQIIEAIKHKQKYLKTEEHKRNVVYKAKYIEIEQPTNAEIYVVHIT